MFKANSHCPLLHLLLFLTAAGTVSAAADPESHKTICPSTACGSVNITYPFWKHTTATNDPAAAAKDSFCGYAEFGIRCSTSDSGEDIAMLSLPGDEYHVKRIDYDARALTLVEPHVGNDSCPRVHHNVSLSNAAPLSYSPQDISLSFYFNCTIHPPSLYALDCLGRKGSSRVSVVGIGPGDEFEWFGHCEEKVVAPVAVAREALGGGGDLGNEFGRAIRNGFLLDWSTAKECGECEASHGLCGYNSVAEEILCFCSDGAVRKNHCKGGKRNWVLKTIIGIVATLFGMGAMAFVAFLYFRRKKNQYVASSLLSRSRSISSNPSAKMDSEKGGNYPGVHIFSYNELEEATNNFDSAKELGDGGFGTVYHGKLRDGRYVAVKRLYENNYRRLEQFMNEVEILTRLRHQNLVSLYGCTSRHSRELLLVYEYVPNGTVADHLHGDLLKSGSLTWPIRMSIAIETANALTYLHASDIIHRDVKTTNILLDNNFCVKVADFGLSRLFPTDVTHISTAPQGTPGYVDPEYHQCYQLTDKSDVYSFGVVLIELISSKPAVDITRHRHEINLSSMAISKIQNHTLHELVDPSLGFEKDDNARKMIAAVAELAFQCLQSEKEMRPSMEEVLEGLKRIQCEAHKTEKAGEMEMQGDDAVLLKSKVLTLSPDTVTVNWTSRSTTPNASS